MKKILGFMIAVCVIAAVVFFALPQSGRDKIIAAVDSMIEKVNAETGDMSADTMRAEMSNDPEAEETIRTWVSDLITALKKNDTKKINLLVGKTNASTMKSSYRQAPKDLNENYFMHVVQKDNDQIVFALVYGNDFASALTFRGRLNRMDGYWQFDCSQEVIDILTQHTCKTCGGYGNIQRTSGGSGVCSICSGTGQMYVPNLYYDANMGWQGGYMVCSGCAGTGRFGASSETEICPECFGAGLK